MGVVYVVTGSAVNLTIDGKMQVLHKSHTNYEKVVGILKSGNVDEKVLTELLNPAKKINEFGQGKLKVKDGVIVYTGEDGDVNIAVDDSLIKRIETMMEEGFDVKPLVAFFENLMLNPSSHAVLGLYKFLESNELPLTDDGCFLAYKKVRFDFKDIRTGTMDNSVGKTVTMLRNQVDDNYNNTCSRGLHFASFAYARDFYSKDAEDHMLILKVNPADVVAFPNDYKNAKGRTCRYEVIGEVPNDKMEYLLKNFQGVKDIEQLRALIEDIRAIVNAETPLDKDGKPTLVYKLNDTLSSSGLHKERIRKIIDAVAVKYGVSVDLAAKLDTDAASIYKLINFVTKEVDMSAR